MGVGGGEDEVTPGPVLAAGGPLVQVDHVALDGVGEWDADLEAGVDDACVQAAAAVALDPRGHRVAVGGEPRGHPWQERKELGRRARPPPARAGMPQEAAKPAGGAVHRCRLRRLPVGWQDDRVQRAGLVEQIQPPAVETVAVVAGRGEQLEQRAPHRRRRPAHADQRRAAATPEPRGRLTRRGERQQRVEEPLLLGVGLAARRRGQAADLIGQCAPGRHAAHDACRHQLEERAVGDLRGLAASPQVGNVPRQRASPQRPRGRELAVRLVAGGLVDLEAVDSLRRAGTLEHGRRPAPAVSGEERPARVLPQGGQVRGGQAAGQPLEHSDGRPRPGGCQPDGALHLGSHGVRRAGTVRVVDQDPLDIAQAAPRRPRQRLTLLSLMEPDEGEQAVLGDGDGLAGQANDRPASERGMVVAAGAHRFERGAAAPAGVQVEQRPSEREGFPLAYRGGHGRSPPGLLGGAAGVDQRGHADTLRPGDGTDLAEAEVALLLVDPDQLARPRLPRRIVGTEPVARLDRRAAVEGAAHRIPAADLEPEATCAGKGVAELGKASAREIVQPLPSSIEIRGFAVHLPEQLLDALLHVQLDRERPQLVEVVEQHRVRDGHGGTVEPAGLAVEVDDAEAAVIADSPEEPKRLIHAGTTVVANAGDDRVLEGATPGRIGPDGGEHRRRNRHGAEHPALDRCVAFGLVAGEPVQQRP